MLLSDSIMSNHKWVILFILLDKLMLEREAAVSLRCDQTMLTATVNPQKMDNLTIGKISIEGCPESSYNVSGYTVTTTFDKCARNITQSKTTITQVRYISREFFCQFFSLFSKCVITSRQYILQFQKSKSLLPHTSTHFLSHIQPAPAAYPNHHLTLYPLQRT